MTRYEQLRENRWMLPWVMGGLVLLGLAVGSFFSAFCLVLFLFGLFAGLSIIFVLGCIDFFEWLTSGSYHYVYGSDGRSLEKQYSYEETYTHAILKRLLDGKPKE